MVNQINQAWCDELPQGWHDLFTRLLTDLEAADGSVRIVQAKQKFGQLRVYLERSTDQMNRLIDEASRQSARTCERCGARGRLMQQPGGYFETVCFDHKGKARPVQRQPIVASYRYSEDGELREIK